MVFTSPREDDRVEEPTASPSRMRTALCGAARGWPAWCTLPRVLHRTPAVPNAAIEMRSDAALVRRALLPAAPAMSDTHLIGQMQAGSQRAFEVISDRHHQS
jgi:hypothetical protein